MSTEIPDSVGLMPVVPPEVLAARRPEIIYTEAYLDDPIEFRTRQELINDSMTQDVGDLIENYRRDVTGYRAVYINSDEYNQVLSVSTYSPRFSRTAYLRNIDRDFRELS